MSTRRSLLQGALVIGCAALFGSPSQAGTPQVEANKAVARTFIESLGTAGYAAVAKKSLASDYKLARHEFENLKYNADDPVLKTAMQPDAKAIPDRANAIVKILGEGDTVAAMFRITGTHKGNLYGIPATGKPIDIEAAAVLKLKNGKITESWVLSNEAALLVQLGARLPERKDGKLNLAPVYDDVRSFDDSLQAWMAHPQDTPEYRHSKLLMAYKAKNKPDDYKFGNRPYQNLQRGGIDTIVARAAVLNVKGSHGQSMIGRQDMLANVIAEGNQGMFQFRLTAKNTGPLYGIPPSGRDLHDWEIGFAEFDGDTWTNAWYLGDELGFLLTIGNKEALDFLVGPAPAK